MLGFLAGVPGRLKTLTDRLTATWAAKLDTLHDSRLTSARAGYLDKLNITGNVAGSAEVALSALETTPMLDVPIASGIAGSAAITLGGSIMATAGVSGVVNTTVSGTTYSTVFTHTGQGVLQLAVLQNSSASYTSSLKITLDGVVLAEETTAAAQYSTAAVAGMAIFSNSTAIFALDAIPYKTSCLIEAKLSNAGGSAAVRHRVRKTS